MAANDLHSFVIDVLRLVRDLIKQFRKQETVLFRFTESHSRARLAIALVVTSALVGPVFYRYFVWVGHVGLVCALAFVFGVSAIFILGLRTTIVVTPTKATVTKKWLLIPYWRCSARDIDDVCYGGDWGNAHYAAGVVVLLGAKQIHIGSGKTMHALYSALLPLSKNPHRSAN